MEALQIKIQTVTSPRNHQPQFMTFFFSSRLRPNPKSCFTYPHLRAFFSAASAPSTNPISTLRSRAVRVRVGVSDAQLKENWLASLSCPFPQGTSTSTSTATYVGHGGESNGSYSASNWVIGVDPDVSGALALLKGDDSADSAQVFDSPQLQVLVGKRVRKRLDAKSIVQLLCSFGAPIGVVEWRVWIWNVDWDLSCIGVFCCSSSISCVEEEI